MGSLPIWGIGKLRRAVGLRLIYTTPIEVQQLALRKSYVDMGCVPLRLCRRTGSPERGVLFPKHPLKHVCVCVCVFFLFFAHVNLPLRFQCPPQGWPCAGHLVCMARPLLGAILEQPVQVQVLLHCGFCAASPGKKHPRAL